MVTYDIREQEMWDLVRIYRGIPEQAPLKSLVDAVVDSRHPKTDGEVVGMPSDAQREIYRLTLLATMGRPIVIRHK